MPWLGHGMTVAHVLHLSPSWTILAQPRSETHQVSGQVENA
jgi:hypothetical protein